MPLPLLPEQEFHIEHRLFPADYIMPKMEMATDHYSMGYIISGERFTITPDQSYEHHAGELGTMPPYIYHKTMPLMETDTPYESILLKFAPKFAEPFIDAVGQSVFDEVYARKVHKFLPEDSEKLYRHLSEMVAVYESDFPQKTAFFQYMLYALFLMILRLQLDEDDAVMHPTTLSMPVVDAIYYMEQNYRQNPSLEETARIAGYSPAYFSKMFQTQLGRTYSDYFATIKLKHVQRMLLSTDKNITEIAHDTGYRHVSNLSEQFKKMTGVSPTQFRKRN